MANEYHIHYHWQAPGNETQAQQSKPKSPAHRGSRNQSSIVESLPEWAKKVAETLANQNIETLYKTKKAAYKLANLTEEQIKGKLKVKAEVEKEKVKEEEESRPSHSCSSTLAQPVTAGIDTKIKAEKADDHEDLRDVVSASKAKRRRHEQN